MSLRIIGGSLKNRTLKAPKGPLSRPTLAIMRKAVFDICQGSIEDADFLDLFACSGAMGIEAISRGAATATFIEKDRLSIQCLQENLKALQIQSQAHIFCGDVFSQIKRLSSLNRAFHIVYIDPPYPLAHDPKKPLIPLLHELDESSLLLPNATVFLEEGFPGVIPVETLAFTKLRFKNTRKFSQSLLHQFQRIG